MVVVVVVVEEVEVVVEVEELEVEVGQSFHLNSYHHLGGIKEIEIR